MERRIIEKIGKVIEEEIQELIKNVKTINEQNNRIYDYLENYMPYIDKNNDDYDIEIIRETESINIHFRINKEPYLLTIITY